MRRERLAVAGLVALAGVPLLVALGRAARDGWYPLGDNAYLSLRSRDVLTQDHPLLGTWTSASVAAERELHNPGPLLFDLLAGPAKVDARLGVAVGAVLVNLAAIATAVVAGFRLGGLRVAATVAAAAAALSWSLGSGLLVEPWQPHSLLLPALAFLVLAWGVLHGRPGFAPAAVFVASVVVQTHVSYAYLVLAVGGVAAAVGWRRARHDPDRVRWALGALVVGLLAWAQPVADQIGGKGNLTALASSLGSGDESTGWDLGLRLTASVAASTDGWYARTFGTAFVPEPLQRIEGVPGRDTALQHVPGLAGAVAGLALVAAVMAAAWWGARRRDDGVAADGVLVAALALVAALGTAATIPLGPLGLGPHQLRFLWPVAILATAVAVLALVPRTRWATALLAAGAAGFALANLPAHDAEVGPSSVPYASNVMEELAGQLDELDPDLTYFVDAARARLYEPYTTPLMLELQRRGIEFTVSEPYTVPQVGDRRRDDGDADATLAIAEGVGAIDPPEGVEIVALVEGLDDDEVAELEELTTAARQAFAVEIPLTTDGERAVALGLADGLDGDGPTVDALIASGTLARAVANGWVSAPEGFDAVRWSSLWRERDGGTVAVWMLAPPRP